MRYLLFTLILILSLSGCEDKQKLSKTEQTKHDEQLAKKIRAEVLAEFETKKIEEERRKEKEIKVQKVEETNHTVKPKNIPLTQMGIHMEKSSITIDTNKTKTFLNNLSKTLEVQMKKVSDDLEKGIIDAKEAGIAINKEHINIDLNKTQNILETWGKKIQLYVNKFDDVSKDLDTNTSK